MPTADCSPVPCRACSTSTSSASASSPPLPVSSTHSADSSLAKCACQAPAAYHPGTRLTTTCRYWGTSETLLPVYQSVDKAIAKHTDVDTVVNFASSRSVYQSTMELLEFPQIKSIAIIAEGVPERVSQFNVLIEPEHLLTPLACP
jgi:succinyl-CoA synthetase alpha subunit